MTLGTHEFIRRFLMHVLPKGFHRIRHYGLLANGNRVRLIARARELLAMAPRGGVRADRQAGHVGGAEVNTLSLPALRQPHGCYTDLRASLGAGSSRGNCPHHQARHLMNLFRTGQAAMPLPIAGACGSETAALATKDPNRRLSCFRDRARQSHWLFQPFEQAATSGGRRHQGRQIQMTVNLASAESP
jgi:hypothetical protein